MNLAQAVRLLGAANEDPILAAWTSLVVRPETRSVPPQDLHFYEAWEAYQELFNFGLITAAEFNGVDQREFLLGLNRPTWSAIEAVLRTLDAPRRGQEPPMTKRLGDPFANNESSLIPKAEPGLPATRARSPLPASSAPVPFGGAQGPLIPPLRGSRAPQIEGLGGVPRGTPSRTLPCTDPGAAPFDANQIQVDLHCRCSNPPIRINLEPDGGQIAGPDDLPSHGQVALIDVVLHGRCPNCQASFHMSAGRAISPEDFRR